MYGKIEEAIIYWERWVARHPGDTLIALKQLADALLEAGDRDGALGVCTRNPFSYSLKRMLTDIYEGKNNIDAAVEYWKTQFATNRSCPTAEVELAYALKVKGDLNTEIAVWKEFYRQGSPDGFFARRSFTHLAQAVEKKGDIDEIVEFWKEQLIEDWHSQRKKDRAYCKLKSAFTGKGDKDGEIAFWKQAFQWNREDEQCANWLTDAFKEKGDFAALIEFWKTEVIEEATTTNRKQLASALDEHGDLDAAIDAWEAAILSDPHDYNLPALLGRAYTTKGDMKRAVRFWQTAASQHPRNRAVAHELANALRTEKAVESALKFQRSLS
jgi:tetratricopeptide (TPR) repeat protein